MLLRSRMGQGSSFNDYRCGLCWKRDLGCDAIFRRNRKRRPAICLCLPCILADVYTRHRYDELVVYGLVFGSRRDPGRQCGSHRANPGPRLCPTIRRSGTITRGHSMPNAMNVREGSGLCRLDAYHPSRPFSFCNSFFVMDPKY